MPYVDKELKAAYQKRTQTPYMKKWRDRNREHHREYIREWMRKRRKNEAKRKMDAEARNTPKNKKRNRASCKRWQLENRDYEKKLTANLADYYVVKQIKKSTDYILKTKDIPKELIEIQRTKLIIHRLLKHFL